MSDIDIARGEDPEILRVAYSPAEVAELIGLSRKAIYRAIERGELVASRVTNRLRIRPADIDAWLEAGRVERHAIVAPPVPLAPLPGQRVASLRRVLDDCGPR